MITNQSTPIFLKTFIIILFALPNEHEQLHKYISHYEKVLNGVHNAIKSTSVEPTYV